MLTYQESMLGKIPAQTDAESSTQVVSRFDGAQWHVIDTPTESFTLTSAGNALLNDEPVKQLLNAYFEASNNGQECPNGVRQFIAEGGNARVFGVQDSRIAVKEKRRGSADHLLPSLKRMDYLAHAVESYCPRWIHIPTHYGVRTPCDDPQQQYMIMERVDDGLTVGDIMGADYEPREKHLGEAMLRIFGEVSPALKEDVEHHYNLLRTLLVDALVLSGLKPEAFLTDLHNNKYNVIIEPLRTPVAGKNYRLTVIDQ